MQEYERNLHQWKLRICKMHICNITSTGALAASETRASADMLSIQVNIVMEWKPEDHVDGKSILLQVMAWCHQAGGHYLNQCWPSSMTQYGIPWPQLRCVSRFLWNFQDGSKIIQGTSVPMGMDHHLDPHYSDAIMSMMPFQITDILIVCSTVCSGADQRKHQNSASLAFVRGIHQWIPSQRAGNTENVSIWWCHHEKFFTILEWPQTVPL